MNGSTLFTAMLPEHLLLLGLVVVIVLEIAGRAQRAALAVALLSVGAAAVAAAVLSFQGYAGGALRRSVLGRSGHPAGQGHRAGAGAAGAVDVRRRIRRRRVHRAAAVVAVRRVPDAVGRQLPDPVPRPRADVAAGLRAGAAGLAPAAERRGGAEVPRARRHRQRDAADGRFAALRQQRQPRHRRLRGGPRRRRRAAARGRGAGDPGLLPEGRDRALPRLGARRLRGGQRAGDGLHGHHRQGRRAARRGASVRPRAGRADDARAAGSAAAGVDRLGQPGGDAPAEPAPHDRLQLDRARRLPFLCPARRCRRPPAVGRLLPAGLRVDEPARPGRAAASRRRPPARRTRPASRACSTAPRPRP